MHKTRESRLKIEIDLDLEIDLGECKEVSTKAESLRRMRVAVSVDSEHGTRAVEPPSHLLGRLVVFH